MAVRKIDQSLQVFKFLRLYKAVHVLEDRPVIGTAETADLHRLHVAVKILLAGDLIILLNIRVALDDMKIDLPKIALRALQNVIGLLHKGLHQLSRNGGRGVDGDHKVLDPANLLILQRFYQGQVFVQTQPVGIEYIVKFVVIDLHDLAHDGKFL